MGSIVVISDVHGQLHWKKLIAQAKEGDEIIFLGDYFDRRGAGPFAYSQVENFLEICRFAANNSYTTLLIGNHDFDYTYWSQSDVSWEPDAAEIRAAIMARISQLQILAVRPGKRRPVIFSHGGLTQTFLDLHDLEKPEDVNKLWVGEPQVFDWIAYDPRTGRRSDRFGDDPWQSPLWARNKALYEDGADGYDQVVGHTPVSKPFEFRTRHGDRILMTCTLDDQPVILED